MQKSICFNYIKLVAIIGIDPVQFTQEMSIASIGTIHALELEAPVEIGCFRIKRLIGRQQNLVKQYGVWLVGEQLAEILLWTSEITSNAGVKLSGQMDAVDPVTRRWCFGGRCNRGLFRFGCRRQEPVPEQMPLRTS